jgi:Rhomboid family
MSSGADLFVVCKQCGSEVSPYITECPYCGHRLRRRAPKLPREGEETARAARHRRIPAPSLGRLRRGEISGLRAEAPPYATIGLVAASCAVWVALHVEPLYYLHLWVLGPLHGDWWRLLSTQLVYISGFSGAIYAIVAIGTIALFGSLLEARHGPWATLVVAVGAGTSGVLVALAAYPFPELTGANGAALGLLAAWAVPDLLAARGGEYYDGDLLGAATIAAVLLAIPAARPEASWLAGVTGGLIGLVLGFGLERVRSAG